jgi:hypothetical protein
VRTLFCRVATGGYVAGEHCYKFLSLLIFFIVMDKLWPSIVANEHHPPHSKGFKPMWLMCQHYSKTDNMKFTIQVAYKYRSHWCCKEIQFWKTAMESLKFHFSKQLFSHVKLIFFEKHDIIFENPFKVRRGFKFQHSHDSYTMK